MKQLRFRTYLEGIGFKYFNIGEEVSISTKNGVNQFTGLFDKQGKEIYEGDICKVINYASDYLKIHGKMYCVISWSNTTGFYGKGFGVPTTFSIGEEFEVIGNLYESPELLEQK